MTHSSHHTAGATKNAVLDLLAGHDGWVSGELLSAHLCVSRAAVAKHVNALRRDGHVIEAAPRRGYRLAVRAEPLRPETVRPFLRTAVLGHGEWRCLGETSSTNTVALAWAAEGAAQGGIVVADAQTRGRGRKGGVWHSAPRSLFCSVILRPDCAPAALDGLTLLTTEATAEAVTRRTGLKAVVKAPNDVFLGGKKCCGILVESGLRAGDVDWVIAGVGCNLNALAEELPEGDGYGVTSLLAETGAPVAPAAFFAELLLCLEERWAQAGFLVLS